MSKENEAARRRLSGSNYVPGRSPEGRCSSCGHSTLGPSHWAKVRCSLHRVGVDKFGTCDRYSRGQDGKETE